MENKNKSKSGLAGWLIVAVIVTIGYLAFFILSRVGISKHNNMTSERIYKSFNEIVSATNIDVGCFPISYIEQRSNDDGTTYKIINNSIIEAYNNNGNTVVKASNNIDDRYDVLLLDGESKSTEYSVSDNSIIYLRIRNSYTGLEHCTVVNYSTSKTNYGMIIDEILGIDEICKILNIDSEDLSEYKNDTSLSSSDTYTIYKISNFTIELPTLESNNKIQEFNGFSSLFIDGTPVLNFLYSEESISSDKVNGMQSIMVNDNLRIDYIDKNPFETDTKAYKEYDILISTIDDSIKTIKYE